MMNSSAFLISAFFGHRELGWFLERGKNQLQQAFSSVCRAEKDSWHAWQLAGFVQKLYCY